MKKASRTSIAIATMATVMMATVLGLPAAGSAADLATAAPQTASPYGWLSEVRFGGFVHDPLSPEKGSVDFNGELLFGRRAFTGFDALIPRFHVGTTVNFAGKTSQVYAGATWTWDVTSAFFLEATFGGSASNGVRLPTPGRNAMGCAVNFRESASAGYRLTQNWSIMATVEHMSNAGLCVENRGLTNAGLRLGYSF
jgi:lipid A 3-O-deacylase